MLTKGVVVLLLAYLTSYTEAQTFSEALATCYAAVRGGGLSETRAQAIAHALAQSGNFAQAEAFCYSLSRLGVSQAQAVAQAVAQSFIPRSISSGDCSLSLAIATCSAASKTGGSLALSDSISIANGLGSQAVAVCSAMANSDTAHAQAGAKALLRACALYDNPTSAQYSKSNFLQAASSAFSEVSSGLAKSSASAAAQSLWDAGHDLTMSAAEACARAAGLSDSAIAEASAHAEASSSGGAGSANSGSSAVVQGNRGAGVIDPLGDLLGGLNRPLGGLNRPLGSLNRPIIDDRIHTGILDRHLPGGSHVGVGVSAGVTSTRRRINDFIDNYRTRHLRGRGRRLGLGRQW